MFLRPYLRLMRLDKPVGIWLLWLPTAWALWIAYAGNPPIYKIALFFVGTVLMRSAGCVINDIADRRIDLHVNRTKMRPLALGELSLIAAFSCFLLLLLAAFLVLICLPQVCFYYALLACLVTIFYPFSKRFLPLPQGILSLAFSLSIPMVYAAAGRSLDQNTLYLFILTNLWVLVYDTQYAMADREDDLQIGICSSAIFFGAQAAEILLFLNIIFHSLWLPLFWTLKLKPLFFLGWGLAIFLLIYQQRLVRRGQINAYLQAFFSQVWYGLLMWAALALGFY